MNATPPAEPELPAKPLRRSQVAFLVAVLCALTACFALLGVRLFFIQVLAHEEHLERALRSVARTDSVPAYSGDVCTRDGVIVARSMSAFDIGLDPRQVDEGELRAAIDAVCDTLGFAAERRRDVLEEGRKRKPAGERYVPVARGVNPEDRERVESVLSALLGPALRDRALVVDRTSRRVYPLGETLCQVVGACDLDGSGQEGVERARAAHLRPRPGARRVITDAREELRLFFPENVEIAPVNGQKVHLTIDSRTQRILEEEIALGIDKHDAEAGHGILMDCRTGEILAMASFPRYDPNQYHRYPRAELERRRKNRVVENVYEPGSVIKPFIAAAVLERGDRQRHDLVWGGGRTHVMGKRRVEDVSDHGPLTVEDCVVYSSNIGMSLLGVHLGPDGLIDVIERFGFCRLTGVDLPFEAKGRHTPRAKWNDVYSTVSVSFGYEMMVTPIQLCAAFAALVNGGYLLRPRIVERVGSGDEEVREPVEVLGRPIREATSRAMREILRRVVTEGTGQYLQMEGFEFGGKTGTADMDPRYTKRDYLASFEGFAPYEDPQVVALVMIEKPRSGKYYGGTVAGPVVARVFRRYFRVAAPPRFEKLKLAGW
jgi:cell division protein FtsI/penicillin-binding protein 2